MVLPLTSFWCSGVRGRLADSRGGERQRHVRPCTLPPLPRSAPCSQLANDYISQRNTSAQLLTRDEVLAVRLYSGPAFQPINTFLRQLAALSGEHRVALARHPGLSFAATCRHLSAAVRKLAAVATEAEVAMPLYRAVRGELKRSFWLADEQGMVVATDTAFMSTSRQLSTPLAYMGDGENVLWELQPRRCALCIAQWEYRRAHNMAA